MKTKVCFMLFICLVNICIAQKMEKIKGDKEVISVTNSIEEEFSILEINDNLKVTVAQSNKYSSVLTTDKNLANVVSAKVKNGVLKLHTTAKITGSKKLELILKVKGISEIILNDEAELETDGTLSSDLFSLTGGNQSSKFDLDLKTKNARIILTKNFKGKIDLKSKEVTMNIGNRTDLQAKIDSDNLTAQLSNSAQLDLDGKLNTAFFNLKNSAELKDRKLKTLTATLNASNNTDIYIHATKDLVIDTEGMSKIFVYGNPNIEVKGLTGRSRIINK